MTGRSAGSTKVIARVANRADTTVVTVAESSAPPVDLGPEPSTGGEAELPRLQVDVTMPAVTGRTINVPPGGDVQAALDTARGGDEIVLQAGATYQGRITLPNRGPADTGWVVVRTSGTLPPPGTRVTPAHAAQMPRLISNGQNQYVIRTAPGARGYRLVGLEVTAAPEYRNGTTLISFGDAKSNGQDSVWKIPSHLILDRSYVHGTETYNFQRCVSLQSAYSAVVDSWISECHGKGFDSQAIAGWNGPGPYLIENNRLEGAGENVIFGGSSPAIEGMVPSDITIRRNHVYKPPVWQGKWTVKNLFELKFGRRVLVEGNVFENNWANAQVGFAILLKSAAEQPTTPWVQTADVTFRWNIVRNSAHGVNMAADPYKNPVLPAARIAIAHNLFERIGTGDYSGGRLFQIAEIRGLTITHNTGGSTVPITLNGSDPTTNLVLTNNLIEMLGTHASRTIIANGPYRPGAAALDGHAPGWIATGNVFVGGTSSDYPAGNQYPTTRDASVAASGAGVNEAMLAEKTRGAVVAP